LPNLEKNKAIALFSYLSIEYKNKKGWIRKIHPFESCFVRIKGLPHECKPNVYQRIATALASVPASPTVILHGLAPACPFRLRGRRISLHDIILF
jgi:hypothetical protein